MTATNEHRDLAPESRTRIAPEVESPGATDTDQQGIVQRAKTVVADAVSNRIPDSVTNAVGTARDRVTGARTWVSDLNEDILDATTAKQRHYAAAGMAVATLVLAGTFLVRRRRTAS